MLTGKDQAGIALIRYADDGRRRRRPCCNHAAAPSDDRLLVAACGICKPACSHFQSSVARNKNTRPSVWFPASFCRVSGENTVCSAHDRLGRLWQIASTRPLVQKQVPNVRFRHADATRQFSATPEKAHPFGLSPSSTRNRWLSELIGRFAFSTVGLDLASSLLRKRRRLGAYTVLCFA